MINGAKMGMLPKFQCYYYLAKTYLYKKQDCLKIHFLGIESPSLLIGHLIEEKTNCVTIKE